MKFGIRLIPQMRSILKWVKKFSRWQLCMENIGKIDKNTIKVFVGKKEKGSPILLKTSRRC
jgi:hypothetical protein